MNAINKRLFIADVEKANSVFLIKKLAHDIPYARAKLFFNNLRKSYENKNKFELLSKDLENADNEIKEQHKLKIINKIYKLYAYKKLEGLCNVCHDYDQKILKPNYGKEFLQKLYLNKTTTSQYNYENKIQSTNKPKSTKLQFKKKNN